jgi:hypothetical protein
MKDNWGTVIAFVAVIAVTFALTWVWRDAVHRGDLATAPRDTVVATHGQETPPYSAQGPVISKPKLPKPIVKDTASNYNMDSVFNSVERELLLNVIGGLNAKLAEYQEVDSFSEDSLRYSLAVTWDGSKQEGTRFWRWLEIKPIAYSDTLREVTQTITQPGTRDWIPWGISGVAIILLVLSMLYG